jgi:hypothetical protein
MPHFVACPPPVVLKIVLVLALILARSSAEDATLQTTVTVWEDYPTVAAVWSVAPSQKTPTVPRHVALIVKIQVVDSAPKSRASAEK